MDFQPPLDASAKIADLHFNAGGQADAYFTDVIHNRAVLYAFWAVLGGAEGGNSSIEAISFAFRENRTVNGNLWTNARKVRYLDQHPWHETYFEEGVEYFYNLHIPYEKQESYQADKVRINKRQHEMAMHPKESHVGSKANEFLLILPWEWSDDEKRNHILGEFNERCTSVSLPKSWLEPLWDHLVKQGYIGQYESFGRFIGFNVQLYDAVIQKFITNELRARRLFFPGYEPYVHVVPQEHLAIAS